MSQESGCVSAQAASLFTRCQRHGCCHTKVQPWPVPQVLAILCLRLHTGDSTQGCLATGQVSPGRGGKGRTESQMLSHALQLSAWVEPPGELGTVTLCMLPLPLFPDLSTLSSHGLAHIHIQECLVYDSWLRCVWLVAAIVSYSPGLLCTVHSVHLPWRRAWIFT